MNEVTTGLTVTSRAWQPRFDQSAHARAKLGFVVLASDHAAEDDLRAICPKGVGVHFTRTANSGAVTHAALGALGPELTRAAGTLLPGCRLDVIAYACTSGSMILGEKQVVRHLLDGKDEATYATSLIEAVSVALRAVGAKKIVVATPYTDIINTHERDHLANEGFDILDIQGLNLEHDNDIARVTPDFLVEMAVEIDRPDADALFISCSGLRSVRIVEDLEQRLGKPVIVSNQALAWHALRLAGINDPIQGYGRLLSAH